MKHVSEGIHFGFETQGRRNQKSKTGDSGLMSSKKVLNKEKHSSLQILFLEDKLNEQKLTFTGLQIHGRGGWAGICMGSGSLLNESKETYFADIHAFYSM